MTDNANNEVTISASLASILGPTPVAKVLPFVTGAVFPKITPIAPAADSQPKPSRNNTNNVYTILGADYEPIATGLKTFAFAYAAALRWSHDLGEEVGIYLERENGELAPGHTYEVLELEERVNAGAMTEDEFAQAMLGAERARLENAIGNMAALVSDIRASIEDAREALNKITDLAGLENAPVESLIDTARRFADEYECRAWYTLIDDDDESMIGELAAS